MPLRLTCSIKMMAKTFALRATLVLVASVIGSSLFAQSAKEAEVIYRKPSSGPVTAEIRTSEIDGVENRNLYITILGRTYINTPFHNYVLTKNTKYPLYYALNGVPEVNFGIAAYRDDSFLPDISDASIQGYLRALKESHGEQIEFLNTERPTFFVRMTGAAPFGNSFARVDYRITKASEPEKAIRVVEFIQEINDSILVTVFQAPEVVFFERMFPPFFNHFRMIGLYE